MSKFGMKLYPPRLHGLARRKKGMSRAMDGSAPPVIRARVSGCHRWTHCSQTWLQLESSGSLKKKVWYLVPHPEILA